MIEIMDLVNRYKTATDKPFGVKDKRVRAFENSVAYWMLIFAGVISIEGLTERFSHPIFPNAAIVAINLARCELWDFQQQVSCVFL